MLPIARLIQLARLVNAAYSPNPDNSYTLPDGYGVVAVIYGNELSTAHKDCNHLPVLKAQFGFIARRGNDFVVAVRGTQTAFEWIQDAKFFKQLSPFGTGYTEDGFTDVYNSLGDGGTVSLSAMIETIAAANPIATLTLTGHSLGGPLMTLTARAIAALCPTVVLFASPHTGDEAFAGDYNLACPDTTRVSNRHDQVPNEPSPIWGYAHVNTLLAIDSGGDPWNWFHRHSLDTYLAALTAML